MLSVGVGTRHEICIFIADAGRLVIILMLLEKKLQRYATFYH